MDDITKNWFYLMWINKKNEKIKTLKDFGCFVGSFWNPEAAKKIQNKDGSTVVNVDEEQFEKASNFVEKEIIKQLEDDANNNLRRRSGRRKKLSLNTGE